MEGGRRPSSEWIAKSRRFFPAPDGLKFLNLMPLPNNIQSDHTYNYTYALTPLHKPELLGTYKFDYNINDRWRSFVRCTRDYYTNDNPAGNGSFESLGTLHQVRKRMGAAINVAATISPTFTNEYTMGIQQRTGKYRFTNGEWYVADTWKVSRNLTIDGGIRFYLMQPIYDAKEQLGPMLFT